MKYIQIVVVLILALSMVALTSPSHAQDIGCNGVVAPSEGQQGLALEGVEIFGEHGDRFHIGIIYPGGVFSVVRGPVCIEGTNWWQVVYQGVVGWITSDALQPLPATTDPTSAFLTPSQTVDFNGVQFAYDHDSWGTRLAASLRPTQVWYTLPDGTWVGMTEARIFTFLDYAFLDQRTNAELLVYPIGDWHNDEAAGIAQALKLLIEKRADIDLNTAIGELPALPIRRAAQNIRAQRTFIAGEGVVGIRFMTRYTQNFSPFRGDDLLYTFQGITTDGRYYVVFNMPLSVRHFVEQLPDDLEDQIAEADDAGFGIWAAYLAQAEAVLNIMDIDLAAPDGLVSSLVIDDPIAQPAFICDPQPQWQVGQAVTLTAARDVVAVYGWDAVSSTLEAGETVLLLDGPACAMGWVWWKVKDGWIYE